MSKEQNQKEKINKKLEKWIKNNIPDDEEDKKVLLDWARLCDRAIFEKLNIGIQHPECYIAIYNVIFEKILSRLKEERSTKSQFSINIADVVEIGYDDANDDGVSEKQGNFTPYIFDIGKDMFEIGKREISALDDIAASTADELTSIERCTAWTSAHAQKQKKTLNDIATASLEALAKDVEINLGSPVVIWPIFVICHQQLREYVKLLQHESGNSSESIDICGNFTVYAHMVGEGEIAVEYKPDPAHKLSTKDDAKGTAVHEDEE